MREKYYTQLTTEEMKLVKKIQTSNKVKIVSYTPHAEKRIRERDIYETFNKDDIETVFKKGKVVKVCEKCNGLRFMIVSEAHNGKKLVLVVNIPVKGHKSKLVTAWTLNTNECLETTYCDEKFDAAPLMRKIKH